MTAVAQQARTSTRRPADDAPTNIAQQSWIMVKRNMIHTKRMPEMLSDVTVQPIMFVLLFAFVFGASIANTGSASYREFLLPGIQAQTIVFTAFVVATGHHRRCREGHHRPVPVAADPAVVGAHRPQRGQPAPFVDRRGGHGGHRAVHRLAHPRQRRRGRAGVRADPGVRFRR